MSPHDLRSPKGSTHPSTDAALSDNLIRLCHSEALELGALGSIPCDATALGELSDADLKALWWPQESEEGWAEDRESLAALGLPEMTDGVNPGDQRALYYLVLGLRPRSILEIGTHIGCSTLSMALAARRLRASPTKIQTELLTVDVLDVNDSSLKPWIAHGAWSSPREMAERLGCEGCVTFTVSDSLAFLRGRPQTFDFIFLDGLHSAVQVYQEVPLALTRLNRGGFILLHDYIPNLRPLWSNGSMIPGPYLALRRLIEEGANVAVRPLGRLPWPTKLNSDVTSLALVVQADHGAATGKMVDGDVERWRHSQDDAEANAQARQAADQLIRRTSQLTAYLPEGEAGLIWQRVCLVSPNPQDVLLGRLLCSFGARTLVVCPTEPSRDARRDAVIVQHLYDTLAATRPDLNLTSLRLGAGPLKQDEDFEIEIGGLTDIDERRTAEFDMVIALGSLPHDLDSALTAVSRLSRLAKVGGTLELLDVPASPLPAETTVRIEAAMAARGLGIGSRVIFDDANPLCRWWLSLVRLSGPLNEYPVEETEAPLVMAHTLARLEFAADYAAGCDVLEAGGGTGIGARLFIERDARRVVCLDRSEEALRLGRRGTNDPRIHFCRWDLDGSPLPFDDASFDLVVALEVLEHITSQEGAVAGFLRVLRPGGRLIVSVPNKAFEDEWASLNRFSNPHHLRVPTEEKFLALLGGFEHVALARQLEFVGSAVVEDSVLEPQGEFVAQTANLKGKTTMVRVAVCTKGPAPLAKPVRRRTRLRLYDNFSELQLSWYRHANYVLRQSRAERQKLWGDLNRTTRMLAEADGQRLEGDRLPQRVSIQESVSRRRRAAGVAVCETSIVAGPWMDRAGEVLRISVATTEEEPGIRANDPCWKLDAGCEPPELSPLAAHPRRVHTVVFPTREARVGLTALWYWRHRGAKDFWFYTLDGWQRADAEATFASLLYRRIFRRILQTLLPPLSVNHEIGERAFTRWIIGRRSRGRVPEASNQPLHPQGVDLWTQRIERDNAVAAGNIRLPTGRPLRIIQYIGSLYAGGAERQLCNLAVGLAGRGYQVQVLTTYEPVGELGHYRHLLAEGGMPVRRASEREWGGAVNQQVDWDLILASPPEIRGQIFSLVAELLVTRPDVLHCWLDACNIIGGIAGFVAGVPRILLSTRNSNPTNFPRLNSPYLDQWYKVLVQSRRVRLLANSRSGAASYASWIGISEEQIHVVLNGLRCNDFLEPTPVNRRIARESFGLAETERVVCGAFRFDEEKQPGLFLEVVRRVAAEVSDLRVLIAGTGPLEGRMRETIKRYRMGTYVRLLGRRTDVDRVLLAGDVFLLTSTLEGCPNAALEAQYLGVPVVATDAGGTCDAVVHGRTGYLAGVHDGPVLATHLTTLLADSDLRHQFSADARVFVAEAFDLDRMIDLTGLVYSRMFTDSEPSQARVVSPRPSLYTRRASHDIGRQEEAQ